MTRKRDLFAELTEGLDALADRRAGKRTLRTHIVQLKPAPRITFGTRCPGATESHPFG